MKKRRKKKLWQFPWAYKESVLFLAGLCFTGIVLQVLCGEFPLELLSYPVNIYCGLFIIISLSFFSFWSNNYIYQWISGIPFSVTVLGFFMLLSLFMGLIPQSALDEATIFSQLIIKLGFNSMTSSWLFAIVYSLSLISLGALIIRRSKKFKWSDYAFYLNHFGLWMILFFAGLGAADIKKFQMYVNKGETEWRVYNKNGESLELPLAIRLNDFVMEEYKPKLVIIDKKGKPLPVENPDYVQIEAKHSVTSIMGEYEVLVQRYIHDAMRKDNYFEERKMTGSCPAALVKIKSNKTGFTKEGWISSGSPYIIYQTLQLDSLHTLVMTQPEPKKFLSDITVTKKPNNKEKVSEQISYLLEVNKPIKIGDWSIYQYGYDEKAGKVSNYSSFELVYDPWVNYVYIGMIILALGSISLLWKGNKTNSNYDLG
ncbi:cytochrome c biogenesis protein ResB [Apibacter raozihei]|uniref:cytochrome c biogenesis protein ResB n=1 Tax=Apibacter raozihei TaxID=2500547 RepID=UPI001E3305A9|nr:cytochrome c biogenesis protein ResB [Apibacter raozihei]